MSTIRTCGRGDGGGADVVADAPGQAPGRGRALRVLLCSAPGGGAHVDGGRESPLDLSGVPLRVRHEPARVRVPGRPRAPRLHDRLRGDPRLPGRVVLPHRPGRPGTVPRRLRRRLHLPHDPEQDRVLDARHGEPARVLHPARDDPHGPRDPRGSRGPRRDGPVRAPPEEAREAGLAEVASGPPIDPVRADAGVSRYITQNCARGTPSIHRTPSSETNPPRVAASTVSFPTKFPIVASRRWARSWSSVTGSPA